MTLPERPLSLLPRWAALMLLVATLVACIGNAFALEIRNTAHEADIEQRLERGERVDMDLYRAINARVAAHEDYYRAAAAEHREFAMPTSPFVTVRTPVLAWTSVLWSEDVWRMIAVFLWGANTLAWFAALSDRGRFSRFAAAGLAGIFGMVAFIDDIPFSHEILAGMMLSLTLALSAGRLWVGGLVLAVFAIALRELALPFLFAWGAVALVAGERDKVLVLVGALALLGLGLALHAASVAAVRESGDLVSPGWTGALGPALALYGVHVTTLLQTLPVWLAGPLGVLALLGWFAVGGRLGAFASLWFAGFIAAVAIFARQENFYWMGLFVPAYGIGLAFVPRALADLAAAIRRQPSASPMSASR
ncbi:hypothetical protein [Qipengyuania qiaonensis]|uniref:DUF2029 domain-containing protein n=1 Tax=Qipengyuania qiaonensis TaxID=2867240 RepID=A0ABS7J3T3_9SPHN|nr:hypothetical protein [Qipengyuania qiaonensis]MBX7481985.1 hypothetical protein [Qipengyuania qiaonensis]